MGQFAWLESEDRHAILSEAFATARLSEKGVTLLCARATRVKLLPKAIRLALVMGSSIGMTIAALRAVLRGRSVIFREFSSVGFLVTGAPVLYPWRAKVLLNVNHNFSWRRRSAGKLAVRILATLGFRFLLLDGVDASQLLPSWLRRNVDCAPFGATQRKPGLFPNTARKPKVGFVGDFRREKGFSPRVLDSLRNLVDAGEVEVVVGYRGRHDPRDGRAWVQACKTESRKEFEAFMRSVDVLVVLSDPQAYRWRHSGTIIEAARYGVAVVVRDLPVLRRQVTWPTVIGVPVERLEDIPAAVRAASALRQDHPGNWQQYLAARNSALDTWEPFRND